ncbi:MAG TPA: hypothetical protein VLJ39_15800, partial [Tepidisphaeraceae bacterium]|nr:hypothetical protein [Tepidisphaeraceae bacterium]
MFYVAAICAAAPAQPPHTTSLLDTLAFGDHRVEDLHSLRADRSEMVQGVFTEPARRLLPGGGQPWEGGKVSFVMKVDPDQQNYLTAKFWGDVIDRNILVLFCEGKQVGYRHLGDIELLAMPDEEPRCPGRFYYLTTPLPREMTRGKREVHFEIRATGPIWGYGNNFEKFQRAITTPTRNLYKVYTHAEAGFVPPADERQGAEPAATPRTEPGPEVLDALKKRVNDTLAKMLKSQRPLSQMELQFLARAYFVQWTPAHQNAKAVDQVVSGVDALYAAWKKDPDSVWRDKSTWNPLWFGVGPAGDAVRLLATPLQSRLNDKLEDIPRREAWSQLFCASRDWLAAHRRWLANQTMFTDCNFYLSNRAVEAIDPPHALPESKAIQWLYQSVGLVPWLGATTPDGPEKQFGNNFYEVTDKGLTKELGYVGTYGEVGVLNAMEIYAATCPPAGEGDPKLKAQIAKMLRGRAAFRYPAVDDDGHPAMRLETVVGWRDVHFPGPVVYAERSGGEGSPLRIPAATLDPALIGYVQEMFTDNQFFALVDAQIKTPGFRSTVGLLQIPDDYALLKSQPASNSRLPMASQENFVFSDEDDGVVAIKHGPEILYVSLYWRAHFGINSLARVHYMTPHYDQAATVFEDARFEASGQT